MEERHFRHLPVLEGGRLAAVISLRDIVEASANAERTACEMTIFSLAKLAESRDPETGSHLERVRELAAVLARSLSEQASFRGHIDEHFILLLRQTSALHDIGKVAVPDYVLLKPSRLTEGEYEIMKSHTVCGAETLDSVLQQFPATEFLKMARDIAAYHHERFDGTGYPDGLVGDQIPLAARVFALVDVYDALATKRVYKEAFSHELATNMILEAEETQFDPRIVSAFRHCQDAFRSIRDQQFSPDTSQHEGIAGHAMAAQV
jgi:putative two-component system response regulator